MPMIIDSIDRIARKKQRDVLYVTFMPLNETGHFDDDIFDWENCQARRRVIKWLETNKINYQFCHRFWADGLLEYLYQGQIYLGVVYDDKNELYKKLESYFENSDGSMKDPFVRFCYITLEQAMKNVHHDAPAYWDDW